MYAVIQTGGKQYRVHPGDILQIEKIEGELGSQVNFDQVLLFSDSVETDSQESAQAGAQTGTPAGVLTLGRPHISGASVQAQVVGEGRGDKILIIKMKRRKQYRRTQGHRQDYTQVLITGIDNGAGQKMTLSDDEKKLKLSKFQSHLTIKGRPEAAKPAHKPLTVGSTGPAPKKKTAAKKVSKAAAPKKSKTPAKKASKKKA